MLNSFLLKWSRNDQPNSRISNTTSAIFNELLEETFPVGSFEIANHCTAQISISYTQCILGFKAISIDQNDCYLVLFYGNAINHSKLSSPAATLLSLIEEGGLDHALSFMIGHYSVVVFDKIKQELHVNSDCTGVLACYYFVRGTDVFIASHELWLLATGQMNFEYDMTSFASLFTINWSLGGKSNFKYMSRFNGLHRYQFSRTGMESFRYYPNVDDLQASPLPIESVYEEIIELIKDQDNVKLELTAGGDSRSLFALMKKGGHSFSSVTVGSNEHLDVRTARRICEIYGIEHEQLETSENDLNAFVKSSKILAFVSSGKANSKRALLNAGVFDYKPRQNETVFGGEFGGIYKGYFYPKDATLDWLNWNKDQLHNFILKKHWKRTTNSEMLDQYTRTGVTDRLANVIEHYSDFATKVPDLFDLYFGIEMAGNFYTTAQLNWVNKHTVFMHSYVIKQAMSMPWGERNLYLFHRNVIVKYLPELNKLPINGSYFVSSAKPRELNRWAAIKSKLMKLGNDATGEFNRQEIMSSHLTKGLSETYLGKGSFSQNLLDMNRLQQMIQEQIAGKNHLQALGILQTFEMYDQLVQRVKKLLK